MQKATTAKENTERSEAKEQAQMDILDWITDKTTNHQDASLNDTKIKAILTGKSYVKEAKDTSFITTKGEYVILYSELYTPTETIPDDLITTGIGAVNDTYKTSFWKKVSGYSPIKGSNWRLFYADSANAYLISDPDNDNPTILNRFTWFGTSTISTLGQNLNSKFTASGDWSLKSDGVNLNNNIKAVAALLDTTKWTDYKTTEANWAIGAPTLEMFIASYNATHTAQLDCTVESKTAYGYKVGINTQGEKVTSFDTYAGELGTTGALNIAMYGGPGRAFYLATPSAWTSDSVLYILGSMGGYVNVGTYNQSDSFVRPVVSVPISKIGNGITITDSY